MIDPVEALMKTSTVLIPTSSTKPSVAPIPTVVPDVPIYQLVGETGSRALWAGFILLLLSFIVFAGLSFRVPIAKRLYYSLTTLVTLVSTLAYFGLALGQGSTLHRLVIHEENKHVPDTTQIIYRQIFFAHYIDWLITIPLILIEVSLLAGVSGGRILNVVVSGIVFVLGGFFSAYGPNDSFQKWGWYTISLISYLVIVWNVVLKGRPIAATRSHSLGSLFNSLALYITAVLAAHVVLWAVSERTRILSVNKEIIAYLILDLLAKPLFGAWILLGHSSIPESQVELAGFWSYGIYSEGRIILDDDGRA